MLFKKNSVTENFFVKKSFFDEICPKSAENRYNISIKLN